MSIGFSFLTPKVPVWAEQVFVLEWHGEDTDGPAIHTIRVSRSPLEPRPAFLGNDRVRVIKKPARLVAWAETGGRFAYVNAFGYPDFIRIGPDGQQYDDLTIDEVKYLTACEWGQGD